MANVLMVVVSYNSVDKTQQTIHSLIGQSVPVDVVVWDNASTDGTQSMLMGIRGINTVLSKTNELWTPAINKAVREFYDGQEYIGFMNNDILLEPYCIEKMIDTLKEEGAGIVGPVGAGLGGPQDYIVHIHEKTEIEKHKRVSYLVGACCLVPKKIWDEVGELDERMPLGADDHDYCIRIKHAGYGVYVRQDTYANHATHSSNSTAEGQKSWADWGGKSWAAFNAKWDGYYKTEEEAVKGHWSGDYHAEFPKGTGWDDTKYQERVLLGNY